MSTRVASLAPAVEPVPSKSLTQEGKSPPLADPLAELGEVPSPDSASLRLLQSVPSALGALRANKGRSVLTTLGIIIGVAAGIAIVALGVGARVSVSRPLAGRG